MILKKSKTFFLGTLRGRLVISVALVHAVMMTLFIVDLTVRQRSILLDRQVEGAMALSQSLSTSAAVWIASDDIAGLQELIESQRRYPELQYAMLADERGRILAHTDTKKQGLYLLDIPVKIQDTIFVKTSSLVDIVVPALLDNRHIGWVRVGVGSKDVDKKLSGILYTGMLYAFFAIIVGSFIAWFMGSRITQRFYAIQETINKVRTGSPATRSSIKGTDEAASIAAEFNIMLDTLGSQYTLLSALINSPLDIVIFSLDKEYRYTAFNEKHRIEMKKVWKVDIEIGMSLLDCMQMPELRILAKQSIDRALNGESFTETQHQPELDIYYDFSWNPIIQNHEIIGITAFIRDVTKQKQNELQIIKLNRIYSVLSNINQAIVRVHEPYEMMREACRIAVEYGKFQMAWIGIVNAQSNVVDVAASYGNTGDYLDKINIDLDNEKRNAGPTGAAVLTGKHKISNDIILDDRMVPWQYDALKYGYKSSASFPLTVYKKVVGAFNLYSDETYFFQEDDVKLLDEMAIDISFALEFIETENERRLVEKALRESEEKYRTLIQKLQTAVVVHGSDTKIVTCNAKAQELLGLTEDQLLGKTAIDPAWHFYREDMTIMPFEEYPVNRVMASRQVLRNFITGVHRPNNEIDVWVLVNADPVFDKAENIVQVIVTFIDISIRKRIEEELHQSEERFRRLAENARDVIYRMSLPDGKYEYVSPAAYSVFGYYPEEFYANPSLFQQAIHPDWHKYFEEQWINLLKGEMPPTYEYQIVHKSGEVRWLNQRNILVRDENGSPIAIEGIVTDITERKHTEDALRLNEGRYRMAQTISHTGNWEYNLQTTHFWGSDEAKRIYGFDLVKDSFTTDEVENCILERERVHQALVDLIQENIPYDLEFEIHPKNSSESRIITSIAELQHDELGKPLRVVGVIQDVTGKRRAEEALKTSALRLNEAQRLAHIGSWELDLNNNNLIWTAEIYRIFEIDPEKFNASYEAFLDAIHPDDREAVNFAYTNSLKNRTPYSIDHRLLFPDGRIKYVHEQCETCFDGDKPVRSTGTVQDITERRLAEEALKESEWRYREIFDNVLDGLYLLEVTDDGRFRTIEVNPALERLTGIPRSFSVGKTQEETVTAEVADIVNAKYRRCVETGQPIEEEVILELPTGQRYFHSSLIPAHDKDGQIQRIVGISRDITDRKEAEQKLKLLNFSLNNVYDETYLINEKSGFDYVNDECCRTLGYSSEELLKMNVSDIDPDFPFEKWQEHWKFIMEHGSMVFEGRHKTKDGIIYPVEISANYFEYNGKGYNLAMCRNISERKLAESEIQKLNQELERRVIERTSQLEAANKELEAFAYSVSHDLRAPLRGMDGFSQVLLEEYENKIDAQGKNYLKRIRSAAQRMAQLIDDMLGLSRINRTEMDIKHVNLSDIAREIANYLYETQPDRQVEFIVPKGIIANGDGRLLRIVLENLIGNAWKFTSKHPKALIEFGRLQQNEKWVYFVRDDGAGFDMKYAEKLFGAFQRLHTGTEFPGTGVGLATVQRVIHRHGGEVWAEGEIEKGATFYFTIP